MRNFAAIAGALAVLALPMVASAQTRVGLYRGVGEYDLSGVDDAPITALRVSRTVGRLLAVEASVTHVELDLDSDPNTKLVQPEVQLQLQLPLGSIEPYLGAGVGGAFASADSADDSDVTLNAGLGLRIDLPFGLGFGVDGRLRSFGTRFTASGADASIGISYRF